MKTTSTLINPSGLLLAYAVLVVPQVGVAKRGGTPAQRSEGAFTISNTIPFLILSSSRTRKRRAGVSFAAPAALGPPALGSLDPNEATIHGRSRRDDSSLDLPALPNSTKTQNPDTIRLLTSEARRQSHIL
jgi:hypothetical protein